MDALTQLLESYASLRAGPFTDALALGALAAARDGLLPWHGAVRRGEDDDAARSQMAFASLASGITLAQAGLGAVHGLAAPLGALFPVPHGIACGATVAAVTRANVAALQAGSSDSPSLARYATLGRVLGDDARLDDRTARATLVAVLDAWTQQLEIPGLATYGIGLGDLPSIVAGSRGSSMRTNPVVLSDAELMSVLEACL